MKFSFSSSDPMRNAAGVPAASVSEVIDNGRSFFEHVTGAQPLDKCIACKLFKMPAWTPAMTARACQNCGLIQEKDREPWFVTDHPAVITEHAETYTDAKK